MFVYVDIVLVTNKVESEEKERVQYLIFTLFPNQFEKKLLLKVFFYVDNEKGWGRWLHPDFSGPEDGDRRGPAGLPTPVVN